jgi:hypothetical protein
VEEVVVRSSAEAIIGLGLTNEEVKAMAKTLNTEVNLKNRAWLILPPKI